MVVFVVRVCVHDRFRKQKRLHIQVVVVVMASSNAIREEYLSSLADLDQNSKPMIDMLTMLAEDHRQHAPIIVDAIKQRISQVLHFFVFYDYCVISYYYLVRKLIRHC